MSSSTKSVILILVCFLLCRPNAVALPSETDSLRTLYYRATEDTLRIQLLFHLGNQFLDGPSDSLIYYYHSGVCAVS